jgi:hypothetical protein
LLKPVNFHKKKKKKKKERETERKKVIASTWELALGKPVILNMYA